MGVRAVLFDLDGTLVDSAEDLREALNRLLAEEGLRAVGLAEIKGMIGDGGTKLLERALAATGGDPGRAAALLPRFLSLYEGHAARRTRPYPGVVETLERLATAGLRLGCVTNKPSAATAEILQALGLARFFGAVVGGDVLPRRKPHPDQLLHAAEALGVAPSETVMVGDNYHDVAAARAAGMGALAVTYGYSHVPHAELGADRLLDRFEDVLAALPLP
ncbi:MAG TPA: phosphoglycolate phosphatase [Beijerinckiaceae bacterium]|nr:phosphoglycolate phosphatase [Beijerinckiaceae bacterium]